MASGLVRYLRFIYANRRSYFTFNKQLLLSGFAGFFAGIGVAEAVARFTSDEVVISVSSGVVDYAASIVGFLALYYYDNRPKYPELAGKERVKRIMKDALSLWPSVAAADVAFIVTRPYVHSVLLLAGFEAGIGAAISHFAGVAIFNGVALLSKSIIDYLRHSKQQIDRGS